MALELSTKIPKVKDVIEQIRELSADEKLTRNYRQKQLYWRITTEERDDGRG